MDFETGKLFAVARHQKPNRKREYRCLWLIVVLTSLPYVLAIAYWPAGTICLIFFAGYFQVLLTFAASSARDTAHYVRFLMAGSNPIGMVGASSLLFGAVDALFDWREDSSERRRAPLGYWGLTLYKFAMTPVGLVLMACEYLWDAVLMRRPLLVRHKWRELFSMADFHAVICPEKSNDVLYADLAFARYRDDMFLYQWNRMRAMVFELRQQQIDAELQVGVPATNVFLQDDFAAYQTLKRLELESIEGQLQSFYSARISEFPCPPTLAKRLIKNAQPIEHYLRMRHELLSGWTHPTEVGREFSELIYEQADSCHRAWKVLRLLDEDVDPLSTNLSHHINHSDLMDLVDRDILRKISESEFAFEKSFLQAFEALLDRYFRQASTAEAEQASLETIPSLVTYRGKCYVRIATRALEPSAVAAP